MLKFFPQYNKFDEGLVDINFLPSFRIQLFIRASRNTNKFNFFPIFLLFNLLLIIPENRKVLLTK